MKTHPKSKTPKRDWLRVELRSDGHSCTIILSGDLCGTSISALETQVDQLGSSPWTDVIIDLRRLATIDGIGANVLVGLNYYIDARGGQMTVVGASAAVAAALRNCHDGTNLRLVDTTLQSALVGSESSRLTAAAPEIHCLPLV
jgi:anti-anti-sigma factor